MSTSPFTNEWLRAIAMPMAGTLMFLLGIRISRLIPRWRVGLSVAAVLLAIAAGIAHYQPFRSLLGPGAERIGGEAAVAGYMLLVLVGVAHAKTRRVLANTGVCLAYAIILVFALSPLYWHYLGRAFYSNYPGKNGCIQQTTGVTCAPASASMLLKHYGFRVSEGLLAERAGTNFLHGTNEFSLARALDNMIAGRGLRARAGHLTYEQARELNRPFVAYMVLPNVGGHAVLVTSLQSDIATVSDPLSGASERISLPEFKEQWSGNSIWILDDK